MHTLPAYDILRIWEHGYYQHPVDRALTILAVAFPEMKLDELANLSIGQRDAYLLTLREKVFGIKLNSFAKCPQCNNRVEFTTSTSNIRAAAYPDSVTPEHNLSIEGLDLRFRLPNSRDLAVVISCNDPHAMRSLLIQRCVLHASREGIEISSEELSEETITKLAECMAEYDPQAEVLLNVECPDCNYNWQVVFDIVSFFWAEIASRAKRLLHEVHILALAYGWREADILSLSTTRRQFYLEMVS